MKVLVVGGAGYIGSHTVRYLSRCGYQPVVYDNLSLGFAEAITGVPLVVGDLHDQALLEQTLREHQIEAVVHFAAYALVGESVNEPAKYYENNVIGTFRLLQAMRSRGVTKLVFSSTCATYGVPAIVPIEETQPQRPINPYGFTKLAVERMLQDFHRAYGLRYAALRYFNAAGATPTGDIGEDHTPESHLIPIVLQVALGQRPHVTVFGTDYPTPDGTCIRDYVHVDDLAAAHERALARLEELPAIEVNLGSGRGFSVREVIAECQQVTGRKIAVEFGPRRAGDPPQLVAKPDLAKTLLGWEPIHSSLTHIVQTAWGWHSSHPQGYATRQGKPRVVGDSR
ncbi:MAG: UDP-glucose 4-epimerase GalE [Planctomycetaceae bacterium]|nr:UDP-glucose 4-epimerase GalE [Planctomycetaceae bacterium]